MIFYFLRVAPDHYNPEPGIEADLKSIIGGALYCGK
jgi:hypothetical protein